jgi:hypothetical protein
MICSVGSLALGMVIGQGTVGQVLYTGADGSGNPVLAGSTSVECDGNNLILSYGGSSPTTIGVNSSLDLNAISTGRQIWGTSSTRSMLIAPGGLVLGATVQVITPTNQQVIITGDSSNPTNLTLIGSGAQGSTSELTVQLQSGQTAPAEKIEGISSTSAVRDLGYLDAGFSVSTDASYLGFIRLMAQDFNAVSGGREGLRVGTTGSAATIGFLGTTPAIQQAGGAATAGTIYTTNEQTMLQVAYNALRTFGLLS